MSDSVTIEDSKGNTFAEVIDVVGTSEIKKAFQPVSYTHLTLPTKA